MKSLSRITLPTDPQPSLPADPIHDPVGSYANGRVSAALSSRGPKIQTIVDVISCEFATQGQGQDAECHGIRPSPDWTPVHYAAYHNREAALLHLLQAGKSAQNCTEAAETPLLVAVAAGHINIVSVLLSAGANPNAATSGEGETALHISIRSGRPDIMHVILAYKPDLNAQATCSLKTPLHYAAARTDASEFVTALLDRGAAYDLLDSEHCTAAETAIAHSNFQTAIAIVIAARGDDDTLSKEKKMLLDYVSGEKNRTAMTVEQVTGLVDAACPPGSTGLIEVIKRGDVGLAETFLEKGVDPNEPDAAGLRPVFLVLKSIGPCRIAMLRLLAKYKVDVSIKRIDALSVLQAALEEAPEDSAGEIQTLFELLISQGADPHAKYSDGKTLLHRIVSSPVSNARLAHQLLINGVDPNAVDNTGSSAIYYASTKPCVRVLLDNSANPNLRDERGDTPLLAAIKRSTKETELHHLEPLFRASDLRAMDTDGKTALHVAAEKGYCRTVALLLARGMSPAELDSQRRTPLLLAARAHQWKVIPLLAMQPGSNVRECDGGMKTALHYVVTSIPQPPSTWEDIAAATASFGSRSRSLRMSQAQTPLISAVIALPEGGLPVIEALLEEKANDRIAGSSNCAGHEDLEAYTALQRAVQLEKPNFVLALLKGGAPFRLDELAWAEKQSRTSKHKETLKVLAEHVYIRYVAGMIRRTGHIPQDCEESNEPQQRYKFPAEELEEVLSLGLDPNALPTSRPGVRPSLLWVILAQTLADPPLPLESLHDALALVLRFKADPNAVTTPRAPYFAVEAPQPQTPIRHPLTLLIEEHPTIDIAVIRGLLEAGSDLTIPSSAYQGRYPLHSATKANRLDIVEEFIQRQANINSFDEKNQTPLFLAVESDYTAIADLLVQNGGSVDIPDCPRKTSLDLAEARRSEAVVHKVKSAYAEPLDAEGQPAPSRRSTKDGVEQQQQTNDGVRIDGLSPSAELQEEQRRFQQKGLSGVQERERLLREEKEVELRERERDLTQRTLSGEVVPQVEVDSSSCSPPPRQSRPPIVAPDADPRNLGAAERKQRRRGMNLSAYPVDARDSLRSAQPPLARGHPQPLTQHPTFRSNGASGPGAYGGASGRVSQQQSQYSSPASKRRSASVPPKQQRYAGLNGGAAHLHGNGSSASLAARSPAVTSPAASRGHLNGVLPPQRNQGAPSPSQRPLPQDSANPKQEASYFPSVSADQQNSTSEAVTPAAASQNPIQPVAFNGNLLTASTQHLSLPGSQPPREPTASYSSPPPNEGPNVSVNEVSTAPGEATTSPNPATSTSRPRRYSFSNFLSSRLNCIKTPLNLFKTAKPSKDSSVKEDGIDKPESAPRATRKPSANFLHAKSRSRSKSNLFKSANANEPSTKKSAKKFSDDEGGTLGSDSLTSTDVKLLDGTVTGLGPEHATNRQSDGNAAAKKTRRRNIDNEAVPPLPTKDITPHLTVPAPAKPLRMDSGVGDAKEQPQAPATTYKTLDPKASLLDYEDEDDSSGYPGRGRKPAREAELSDWLEFQSVFDRL